MLGQCNIIICVKGELKMMAFNIFPENICTETHKKVRISRICLGWNDAKPTFTNRGIYKESVGAKDKGMGYFSSVSGCLDVKDFYIEACETPTRERASSGVCAAKQQRNQMSHCWITKSSTANFLQFVDVHVLSTSSHSLAVCFSQYLPSIA